MAMKRLLLHPLHIMILTGLALITVTCTQIPHALSPVNTVHPAISARAVPTASPTPTPTPPSPVTPFPRGYQQEVTILQAHDRLVYYGNPTRREIALTFDDGPSANYTPQILIILRRY